MSRSKLVAGYYPDNYDDIIAEYALEDIVDWLNNKEDFIRIYYKQLNCDVKELRDSAASHVGRLMIERDAVVSMLKHIGVNVGFDMVGHRDKWCIMTHDVVEAQIDWEDQCRE